MVEADEYKHLSLRSLALLGNAFASYGTWSRLVRDHGRRRGRRRLYPAKAKVGIRASIPNEWWHVDVTIIRLLDGTRTYLNAVVDNYSRRVLPGPSSRSSAPKARGRSSPRPRRPSAGTRRSTS